MKRHDRDLCSRASEGSIPAGIEAGSHFSTTQSLRPAGREPKREDTVGLYQTVSAYMRLRQMVWDEQALKQRIPRRTATEMHTLEMQCASGLRKLNAHPSPLSLG